MSAQNTKLRLLYIYQMLLRHSDESHPMSAADIEKKLSAEYGIKPDRRSIYHDIDTLTEFGVDIVTVKGNDHGYFIASRDFELPELKILVDVVQVSKFITPKKSRELIEKIEKLGTVREAKQLEQQVTIYQRPKSENEKVFYNVDTIHQAIYQNQRIRYQYGDWNEKKIFSLRHDGAWYEVSPWALIYDDENYYLVAFDTASQLVRHYRVDRMVNTEIMNVEREGQEQFRNFNLSSFEKKTFGMFAGKEELVTLQCNNDFAGIILDRFGRDVMLVPDDADHFHVKVSVAVSPQFFGWVTALGDKMKIIGPADIKGRYLQFLEMVISRHNE